MLQVNQVQHTYVSQILENLLAFSICMHSNHFLPQNELEDVFVYFWYNCK